MSIVQALWWMFALVKAAHDCGVFKQFIFADHAEPAAPLARASGIGHKAELMNAAGIFRFENFNRRHMQVAKMARGA